MSVLGRDSNGNTIQAMKQGAVKNVDFDAHTESSAFQANTSLLRLCCDQDCYYLIAAAPVATTSNGTLLPAGAIDFVPVQAGQSFKISAIKKTAAGRLNITEGAN